MDRLDIVTLLLDRGEDVNLTSGKSCTALGATAWSSELGAPTLLLDRGADPDPTSSGSPRPRDLAERAGHRNIVDLLDPKCMDRNPSELTKVYGQLDLIAGVYHRIRRTPMSILQSQEAEMEGHVRFNFPVCLYASCVPCPSAYFH